jgi:hypothetical protein
MNFKNFISRVLCLYLIGLPSSYALANSYKDWEFHKYLNDKDNQLAETFKELNNKDNQLAEKLKELNDKNFEIVQLRKLVEQQNITYEEVETNQSIYVFSTDVIGVYKVGESSRDITKRKKELQTSCVKNIVILFEFKTCNSKLLENIIHDILGKYRYNSCREHFECDIDYIKHIITIAGTCLNSLKSTFQYIEKEELVNIIIDKLTVSNNIKIY